MKKFNLKKLIAVAACLLCFFTAFAACGGVNDDAPEDDASVICVVTFVFEDGTRIYKDVVKGNDLTDIPALPEQTGYTYSWSVTDFSAVTENITVTTVKTPNSYVITYDLEGADVTIESDRQTAVFDSRVELYTPKRDTYNFKGWVDEDGQPFSSGVFRSDKNITLKAVWEDDNAWSGRA